MTWDIVGIIITLALILVGANLLQSGVAGLTNPNNFPQLLGAIVLLWLGWQIFSGGLATIGQPKSTSFTR